MADIISDYLGGLNEDLIKDNFVIVYEVNLKPLLMAFTMIFHDYCYIYNFSRERFFFFFSITLFHGHYDHFFETTIWYHKPRSKLSSYPFLEMCYCLPWPVEKTIHLAPLISQE